MFLEQINRRLEEKIKARENRIAITLMSNTGKTIAIKAEPTLYERLQTQMEIHGIKSVKQMVFVAVQVGLAMLEEERR